MVSGLSSNPPSEKGGPATVRGAARATVREIHGVDNGNCMPGPKDTMVRVGWPTGMESGKSLLRTTANPAVDPIEAATWTMLSNLLLNLDEALVK